MATLVAQDIAAAPARGAGIAPMVDALRSHWPTYLMEAAELGLFMVSACVVTALLGHPSSPIHRAIPSDFLRRALTGIAMGLTAFSLVHSPMGRRSGAHMNPSFTLMFLRLKKIAPWDACFYAIGQFLGGFAGVLVSWLAFGTRLAHEKVNYAATLPGTAGVRVAFVAELSISFLLALTVLLVSNHWRLSRLTPYFSASLIAAYITFEAPSSGMNMNPARTLGSAILPHAFRAIWIYFVAPPIGMLQASELYLRLRSGAHIYCAKLDHHNSAPCIFHCRSFELLESQEGNRAS